MKSLGHILLIVICLLSCISTSLGKESNELNSSLQKIDKLEKERRISDAINVCEEFLSKKDISEEDLIYITLRLAILYESSQGKADYSIKLIENVIKKYPDNKKIPDCLFYLANSYYDFGEKQKSTMYCTSILEKYPDYSGINAVNNLLKKLNDNKCFIEHSSRFKEAQEYKAFIHNLPKYQKWLYVVFEFFRLSFLRFSIIIIFIIAFILFSSRFYGKSNFIFSITDLFIITTISIFTTPIFWFLFLLKYGVDNPFCIYEKYILFSFVKPHLYYFFSIGSISILILFLLNYMARRKISLKTLFFNKLKIYNNLLVSILLCIILIFCLYIFDILRILPIYNNDINIEQFTLIYTPWKIVFFFFLLPIFHGIFFRGILFSVFESNTNFYLAAFLSSILYSLYFLNFNIPNVCYLFVLGFFLCVIFKKIGLFPSILLHSTFLIVIDLFGA